MSVDPDQSDLPEPLADALRSAYAHRVEIPQRIDESVFSAARAKFDHRRRLRMLVRWGSGVAAGLAAVIALAVVLHRPTAPAKAVAKGDVNADGQVNMVDALVLARHVAAGDQVESAWDVNHDGKVDQADVQALASAAVRLKQGGLAQRLPRLQDIGIERAAARFTQRGQEPSPPTSYAVRVKAPDPFGVARQSNSPTEEGRQ